MADLYELSDGLFELRRMLDDYGHEARMLDPADARAFAACLKEFGAMALKLEHEVSRHRWNSAARADRAMEEAVAQEALRPNTNLRLFWPAFRGFSDGRPRPGAAS